MIRNNLTEMKVYLRRALKYLLWLAVLLAAIFALMRLTGTGRMAPGDELRVIFGTQRGLLMVAVIVLLAALYPRFGFVRRFVPADLGRDREVIVKVMERSGYRVDREVPGEMVFVADSAWGKVRTLWEDRIVVTQQSGGIVMDGIRKEVVRIEFRLKSFL